MVVKKAGVALGTHFWQQGGKRSLHIANQRQIDGSVPADMIGPAIDLHLLYAVGRQKLRKRKIRPQQQQELGFVNGAVGAAVSEKARHSHRVGILTLQPLLAAKRIADGCF